MPAPLRTILAARRDIPPGTMAELCEAYSANPGPKNLERLERALMVTGPVLYRSNVYGIADARPVEGFECFSDVQRAELVRIP